MKKLALISAVLLLGVGSAFGAESPVSRAFNDDGGQPAACVYCGMDLGKFAHSRMVIDYDDGRSVAVCSLHCAAVDLALNIDRTPKAIRVGDYASQKLIDAEAAAWLIDTGKPGVMTTHAKWAFESQQSAEKHLQENGGRVVSFAEAMKAAYEDMHQDNRMIREKRGVVRAARQAGMSQAQVTSVASAQTGQMGHKCQMGRKGRMGGRGHGMCKMKRGGMTATSGQQDSGSAPSCH
jgi:nitrous oxide reductase accessory protein NosL